MASIFNIHHKQAFASAYNQNVWYSTVRQMRVQEQRQVLLSFKKFPYISYCHFLRALPFRFNFFLLLLVKKSVSQSSLSILTRQALHKIQSKPLRESLQEYGL